MKEVKTLIDNFHPSELPKKITDRIISDISEQKSVFEIS
jgi:hypothetical protein